MLERDIHYGKPTVDIAMRMFESTFKEAKSKREKVLKVIVGYGSQGGTCKIKNSVIERLEEMKGKNQIKDYICGNELDMFSEKCQKFQFKELIPDVERRSLNKGAIFIIL